MMNYPLKIHGCELVEVVLEEFAHLMISLSLLIINDKQ